MELLKIRTQQKIFSKAILKNSEKLTYLLSDILNLATIESGEYSLDIQDMNPKNLIEEIVKNISEQFSLVSIKVDVDDKFWLKWILRLLSKF
ncbi:MAG: hypothetical protein Ct9H300mP20_05170 [Gammaproteobacteria bacterium]|nr:MAG: hypothetical protein Ct9H300mP20_05170 [Gammaproteobacteria bacterium]